MASEWYYAKGGRQNGPVSAQELKQLADEGTLQSSDLVWKEGMDDWTPAGEVRGLLPYGDAEVVDDLDYEEPYTRRRRSRGPYGQIVLIVGAVAMIAAFCVPVPWWSMTIDVRVITQASAEDVRGEWAEDFARRLRLMRTTSFEREAEKDEAAAKQTGISAKDQRFKRDRARFSRAVKKSKRWWEKHVRGGHDSFADYLREEAGSADDNDEMSVTLKIWGWNDGIAIMGLVFGAVILVVTIVFLSVPPIRSWNWIISIVAAIMGLLVVIFAMIWIFSAPSDDVGRYFKQGIIAGPYILLPAGALFLIVGIVDAIFGIAAQLRARRLG